MMKVKKQLEPCEEYVIDDFGRICPVYEMGWSKIPWEGAATFDEAINSIAESPIAISDAFPEDDWTQITSDEWKEFQASRYLGIEEGFFLATGVNFSFAQFRFLWNGNVFFNMRPDFGFLTLATNLGEQPINAVESAMRNLLLDYYKETEALKRAFAAGELEPLRLYPLEVWEEFWRVRGYVLPNSSSNKTNLSEVERATMLKLIIGMAMDAYSYDPKALRNNATGGKNGISAKLARHEISVNDDTVRKYLTEAKELL